MKWTHVIKNKIVASAALLTLCLLVLFSTYIDRKHTEDVKNTISTLYEDRLVAEVYILKMTRSLYEIKMLLHTESANKEQAIKNLFFEIISTSDAYHKTKFTALEKIKADDLLLTLGKLERASLQTVELQLQFTDQALHSLNELSAIQLSESKKIMAYAESLYRFGETSSQFIIALIIIILVVLQAIVFSSKTIIIKEKTDFPSLN